MSHFSVLLRRLALLTFGLAVAATAFPAFADQPADRLWMPETEGRDLSWKRARRHCKRVQIDGRPRYVGPSPGTRERLGNLAVQTLETFLFEPATCDGEPIPVFYHLDFGAPSR